MEESTGQLLKGVPKPESQTSAARPEAPRRIRSRRFEMLFLPGPDVASDIYTIRDALSSIAAGYSYALTGRVRDRRGQAMLYLCVQCKQSHTKGTLRAKCNPEHIRCKGDPDPDDVWNLKASGEWFVDGKGRRPKILTVHSVPASCGNLADPLPEESSRVSEEMMGNLKLLTKNLRDFVVLNLPATMCAAKGADQHRRNHALNDVLKVAAVSLGEAVQRHHSYLRVRDPSLWEDLFKDA